ncbi:amino acid deaminase [Vibrio mediterranei]|jgi:D-serine deaminase-like pyridoxal phosphate-dependent protein
MSVPTKDLTIPVSSRCSKAQQCGAKGVWANNNSTGRYSLIHEEVSLPAAVINRKQITNNLDWMQKFATHHGVELCPHGKTTMTPELFQQQLSTGAWGITVATAPQAEVAVYAGAKRVIIANQLVGRANMAIVKRLIMEHEIELYCCVDSETNIEQLADFFEGTEFTLHILIEYGVYGGRCGCRTRDQVKQLAKLLKRTKALSLVGVEVYEGVIQGDCAEQNIRDFLYETIDIVDELAQASFIERSKPIVTGAGSAWYDVVSECFEDLDKCIAIIRPGCYAIHDTGIYQRAQDKVLKRAIKNQGIACEIGGNLESALEVWAYVISKPESDQAIIGLGKRDVAFDAGLPVATRGFRNGQSIDISGMKAHMIMDQHMAVLVPNSLDIDVGDIVVFSTSHPCLTFDKWRYICVSDSEGQVSHLIETYF